MRLAPLGVIAEKLRSRSVEVRVVALRHAKAHAQNARPLAAVVASLLTDAEVVAWHATGTLGDIASGAADAVPVLVELLQRDDERLKARALHGLKSVGAEAWSALPALEALYDGPMQAAVLEAMAAIAPNAPKIVERIVDALFSDDHELSITAARALENGGPLDAAVTALRLKAFSFVRAKREGAHRALRVLAALRPEPVAQLMRELARGSKPIRALLSAMARLPGPLPAELQELAVRALADEDPEPVAQALKVIEKHHVDAPLGEVMLRFRKSTPVRGPEGLPARVFADAARMSTGRMSPVERAALDAWLDQVLKTEKGVSWYAVAAAVKAAPERRDELAAAAERFAESDASGVLDFKRAVGLKVAEDEGEAAASPTPEAEYPEFPREEEPAPPGRLEPAADAPPLDPELSHGLALLGRSLTARPADLAEGLQLFFQRLQNEQRESPDDAGVQGLAAVWAHALMKQLNWSWARYVRAEERALVLASPDQKQMVFPAAWVRRQLRKKEPTALLQFNMLVSGNAPAPADEPTALW